MGQVCTYLNFNGNTEEAFNFYKTVFSTEFYGPVMRMGDIPPGPDMPELTEAEKKMVMHVGLPILGGHLLMGTDTSENCGGKPATFGDNVHINLMPDTREEADKLFNALSLGGTVHAPMADMFWGDYYGAFTDKFGVHWMVNHVGKKG